MNCCYNASRTGVYQRYNNMIEKFCDYEQLIFDEHWNVDEISIKVKLVLDEPVHIQYF